MSNVFLKPALDGDGAPMLVLDPQTHQPLKAEGEWKELLPYWSRRQRDKEVIESSPPAEPAAVPLQIATPMLGAS